MYEVELKFPLPPGGDRDAVLQALANRGAAFGEPVTQVDVYYNHPVRDFAETDEALRVRIVTGADGVPHGRMTYKGPKVDADTKTRVEFEPKLAAGPNNVHALTEALRRLGFREVFTVTKTRRTAEIVVEADDAAQRNYEVTRDAVEGLGEYLEIETSADDGSLSSARTALLAFAADLGLRASERRSYLGLLLEQSETPTDGGCKT
ncbi:class IV adenylate cyclase [Alienimonas californiensis]|uniref:CYTH domain protein n=1 Tax=Alienimonas californiensis TaxID=2527989 RepID=A0A517PEZ4_9PLAN|nr:class IV adenylate cyclase [Alienimonas californiensis]QDT17933.1 CYTH domain protein [Alienimonas californiensis]